MPKKDYSLTSKELMLLIDILNRLKASNPDSDHSMLDAIKEKLVAQDYELITKGM